MSEKTWNSTFVLPLWFTAPTIYFVNIVLQLELPNKHAVLFSKGRREFRYVIFKNREILLGPEEECICFTSITTNEIFKWNSKKYSIDNDYQ